MFPESLTLSPPPFFQLLSGSTGTRPRDMTKRQRRKQKPQLDADLPVKMEPPQVHVSKKKKKLHDTDMWSSVEKLDV